jgi:hypothetical protein
MAKAFPSLDADDVVQETLIALVKTLPGYRSAPREDGRHRHARRREGRIRRHAAMRTSTRSSPR